MSDSIRMSANSREWPQYLVFEHDAAWGRDGATYLPRYVGGEPEPYDEKPAGYTSRFECATAIAMPKNRAAGVELCARFEALIPHLTQSQAAKLVAKIKQAEDAIYEADMPSLIRSGWRFGDIYRAERDARKMLGATGPRRGR